MSKIENIKISRRDLLLGTGALSALVVGNRIASAFSEDGLGPIDMFIDKAIDTVGMGDALKNEYIDNAALDIGNRFGLDKRHSPETLKKATRVITGVIFSVAEILYASRALSLSITELEKSEK